MTPSFPQCLDYQSQQLIQLPGPPNPQSPPPPMKPPPLYDDDKLTATLVPDVLKGGGDVDLLASLRHAVEDHVDEDVGARPARPVTKKIKRGFSLVMVFY